MQQTERLSLGVEEKSEEVDICLVLTMSAGADGKPPRNVQLCVLEKRATALDTLLFY